MTNIELVALADMVPGNEADMFVLLSERQLRHTKDGKPFYKVAFRDRTREIHCVPIWFDAPMFEECKERWVQGKYYKIRAVLIETAKFGVQLEIRRIREVKETDRLDGFDENFCRPSSRAEPAAMHAEILDLVHKHIGPNKLSQLITRIFKDHREAIQESAAAKFHHHIYSGGLLEHTLSVTQIAISLADHFARFYPERKDEFSKPLVVAGAILHDIGKIREQKFEAASVQYTLEGNLIGHVILGRDFVRDYAPEVKLDSVIQTHLEHIILSHQLLPEWDSPKRPMSLEAVMVHHADWVDAMFGSFLNVLDGDETEGPMTSKRNILGYALFRGGGSLT